MFRRIAGLHIAVSDLSGQAKRLARFKRSAKHQTRPVMRVGLPPGGKWRQLDTVHYLLNECEWLAREFEAGTPFAPDGRAPP